MKVLNERATIRNLVENRWIRVATIDPASGQLYVYRNGSFEEFEVSIERLPVAHSSAEWYRGKIEHLPMAWIRTDGIHAKTGSR